MNRSTPRTTTRLSAWALAAALAATILAATAMDHAELPAALHVAQVAEQAEQAAELEQRMHRAAQALCQAEAGTGAQALWTHDGDLVCRPALITAAGAAP